MIPFSVPSLWLILLDALGALGMIMLPLWALWLLCSHKARARLKRRWWPSALLASVLGFSTFVFAHTQQYMKQIRLEIEAEDAARYPTLTEPTTLAGIELPWQMQLKLPEIIMN